MTPAPSSISIEDADPEFYEGSDLESLADLPRYYRWILETFGPHLRGRTLEVGAGTGNFSSYYIDQCDEAVLLEPAKNLHQTLQERFAETQHVKVVGQLLHDVMEQEVEGCAFAENSFDAAVMVNVLEHIEDDVATLKDLYRLLKPGKALLIFVPALPFLYGSIDKLVHHYRRYTKRSLATVIQEAGFHIQSNHYFDALGILPWLLVGRVLKQTNVDPAGAKLYDRFGVPVTSWFERRFPPLLGKNLISVAYKPA